jgi:hypothetical protein
VARRGHRRAVPERLDERRGRQLAHLARLLRARLVDVCQVHHGHAPPPQLDLCAEELKAVQHSALPATVLAFAAPARGARDGSQLLDLFVVQPAHRSTLVSA